MAFCKNCGAQLPDGTSVCPSCGTAQSNAAQNNVAPGAQNDAVVDSGSFGYGVLGFCIPLVGLILFLVWKDTKPRSAKIAGIGALVSVAIGVVFYIIAIVAGVAASMN